MYRHAGKSIYTCIYTYIQNDYVYNQNLVHIYKIKFCIYNPILCIIKVEIKLNYMKSNYKI